MSNQQVFTQVIEEAIKTASRMRHQAVMVEHMVAVLLQIPQIVEYMTLTGADVKKASEKLDDFLKGPHIPRSRIDPEMSETLHAVITKVTAQSRMRGRWPSPMDILAAIMSLPPDSCAATALLIQCGVTKASVVKFAEHGPEAFAAAAGMAGPDEQVASKEEAEAVLEKYCKNLNKQAADSKIDPLIGRADEVQRMIQIVARRTKNNVILVGEPGVGKTAIAEGLALMISRGDVPEILKENVVYSLDLTALVAGTRFRGDFEERMKLLLKSVELVGNAILFIDEIHNILGAGGTGNGSMDVANLLKPALAKGELRCIGSTTMEEYRKHFEKDRALLRRFKRVDVDQPSVDDSIAILMGLRSHYEDFHKVVYSDAAIRAAVRLSDRFVQQSQLPDKAIDIMDSAGAAQRIASPDVRKDVIDVAEIEAEIAKAAKIPVTTVSEDEASRILRLESDLKEVVYGQDDAITTVSNAVLVARAGLREPGKPMGRFLFTGPTGVGKTEVARQLAKTLGIAFVKYDMSEYMEPHSVSKLIGSPPGYVGYGDGGVGSGKLSNDIDENPHCVLLIDEIEKAHPDIFNVFLQIMEDGVITNSAGKKVQFDNVFLIMTSNAGAVDLQRNKMGFGSSINDDADLPTINKMFPPEFRNRLDAVVRFKMLMPDGIRKVVDKFLEQLSALTEERDVTLEISEQAKDWLALKGFDPKMGARPLSRVINDSVKVPLSRLMLQGKLKDGIAHIDVVSDTLTVE